MESSIKTIVEAGALRRLPIFLAGYSGKILLVADRNTNSIAGEKVGVILEKSGFPFQKIILERSQPLIPDERALAEIRGMIGSDICLLLAIGSGTITDLTRYAAFNAGKQFMAVPTAPSMDGYASPVAALTLKGFKQTLPAKPPVAIIADIEVLKCAPPIMIQAGFGDLIGKYISLADWELSRIIEGEGYSPSIANMVRTAVDQAIQSNNDGIPIERKISDLTIALIRSGEAMLAWGNSRPASGGEHHLAHYWEMEAALKEKTGQLHGIKVGIATLVLAEYYHKLFNLSIDEVQKQLSVNREEPMDKYLLRIKKTFGPLSKGILSELDNYYLDSNKRQIRQANILSNWLFLRKWVSENVPNPARIKCMLIKAGVPITPWEIGINAAELEIALENAKEVRKRYTVFRLAEDLGWKPPLLAV